MGTYTANVNGVWKSIDYNTKERKDIEVDEQDSQIWKATVLKSWISTKKSLRLCFWIKDILIITAEIDTFMRVLDLMDDNDIEFWYFDNTIII